MTWEVGSQTRRVNPNTITSADIAQWQPGERLLLSGKLLTGRDATQKRIADLFAQGQALPEGLDFHNRFIYYVGPVKIPPRLWSAIRIIAPRLWIAVSPPRENVTDSYEFARLNKNLNIILDLMWCVGRSLPTHLISISR